MSIQDAFDDALQDVPPEELVRLPRDAAAEHDHRIYGTLLGRRRTAAELDEVIEMIRRT